MEEPKGIPIEGQKPVGEARRGVVLLGYGLMIILTLVVYGAGLLSYRLLFPLQSLNEISASLGEIKALQEQVQRMQTQLTQVQQELARLNEALTSRGTPQGEQRVQASPDDDPQMGSANAPVVIIEFSDFQCPFCKRFWEQTLPQLIRLYVETGKARLVYRDFPLGFHQNAQLAAEATECADEQGAYWTMHDHLFKNQAEWANDPATKAKERFISYAEALKLNVKRFSDCLNSGLYAQEVKKDYQDGLAYGVNGTPTFFINGYKLVGAQPFEVFQQVIEAELKR